VGASFVGRARAKAIGLWGGSSGLAMAVGPVLGGWLVTDVSWRAAFLITPAMALVAIPIALWHVPESRDPQAHKLDLIGAAMATIALGGLVYGLIESSASGFAEPVVLASLLLGALALWTFVFVERREDDPMVPPSLFRSKNFDGANLVTLLFYMSLTGSLYFVPFLMMQVHGYSALVTGTVFLPFVAMALFLGRSGGYILGRFGVKIPLVTASLAAAVGYALFAVPGVEGGSYWTSFFPAMVVQGFGMALMITPLTTIALGSVEGEHSGLASGVNNAAARVAAPLAVAVLSVFIYGVFSTSLNTHLDSMNLPGEVRTEMEAKKAHLGAAKAPEDVDAKTAVHIERAIKESFVAGFRTVMVICVGLALVSALAAAILVDDRSIRVGSRDSRP
ncbi:MAG: MFS transporter, partial [Actinomycetota bacterium]|nr:MFS transporter [Actinomycetota bacterium]